MEGLIPGWTSYRVKSKARLKFSLIDLNAETPTRGKPQGSLND